MNWRFRRRGRRIHQGAENRLTALRSGQTAHVARIGAGAKARVRLASLGLIPGSSLLVVANPGIGPLLLSVGESRIMVERGVADKVLVDEVA